MKNNSCVHVGGRSTWSLSCIHRHLMTQFIVYEKSEINKSENDSIEGDIYFLKYLNPLVTFENDQCPPKMLDRGFKSICSRGLLTAASIVLRFNCESHKIISVLITQFTQSSKNDYIIIKFTNCPWRFNWIKLHILLYSFICLN